MSKRLRTADVDSIPVAGAHAFSITCKEVANQLTVLLHNKTYLLYAVNFVFHVVGMSKFHTLEIAANQSFK